MEGSYLALRTEDAPPIVLATDLTPRLCGATGPPFGAETGSRAIARYRWADPGHRLPRNRSDMRFKR